MSAPSCACPHCGRPIALVGTDGAGTITAVVERIAKLGIARTSASPEMEIIHRAATVFGVKANDILGKGRSRTTVLARHVAMFVVRQDLKRSYPEIGNFFGNRDHTTAMHAYARMMTLLEMDDGTLATIVRLISDPEELRKAQALPPVNAAEIAEKVETTE